VLISTTGPLLKYVSSATSRVATHWHKHFGQWIIITFVVLHIGAIAFYWQNLVAPMLHGDKLLTADVPAAIDTAGSRAIALAIAAACAIGVAAVVSRGN